MSHHIEKQEARCALIAAMLRMLIVLREEQGEQVDGVACDFSMSPEGDFSGNLASLLGDHEFQGESL